MPVIRNINLKSPENRRLFKLQWEIYDIIAEFAGKK